MTRRLVVLVTLVVALFGAVITTATADVDLNVKLPLQALPIGPGPLYPIDNYGPRPDDNVVLR